MAVRRQDFIPEAAHWEVLSDHPLPIGHGQTISQPSLVEYMTDQLGVEPGQRILEIGTGSGYQAAILADRGAEVFSVEIIGALARQAGERLSRLGFHQVHVRHADGFEGWVEEAPFDGIMVTAAAEAIPDALIRQLRDGGRMVIPLGKANAVQTLQRLTRAGDTVRSENLLAVRFVPVTRVTRED